LDPDYFPPSGTQFGKAWSKFKTVCAFHFSDVYYLERRLAALPISPNFKADVDTLLADKAALERYFQISLYAIQFLSARLDTRAFRGEYPLLSFPEGLTPLTPDLPALTDEQLSIMKKYSSVR
jgi:hypothetical protein